MRTLRMILMFSAVLSSGLASASTINGTTISGNQLTITGTGFSGTPLTVRFNGRSIPVVSSSSTHIVATLTTVPPPGSYRLTVKAGTSSTFSYVAITSTSTIVAQVALTNQTGPIPVTTLLAPAQNGLFRISVSEMGTAGCNSNPPAGVDLNWTDDGGLRGTSFNTFTSGVVGASVIARANAGTVVSYEVLSGNINCTPYELYFTVEQLQ